MPPLELRPVIPEADASLLHRWVTAERAAFWGMQDHTATEVAEVYDYIADQAHLSAFFATSDGRPLALFHTYDPAIDEIGVFYERRPGDLGLHLFFADDPARAGRTHEICAFVLSVLFAHERVERVVLEPDVRNDKSLTLLRAVGAETGPRVHLTLPHQAKDAQFHFVYPEHWRQATAVTSAGHAAIVIPRSY